MAKYLPMYRCMGCGGIIRKAEMPKELLTPIEIPDEKVEVICIGAANPFFRSPNLRKQVPYSVAHNCYGERSQIGAAIFAGFSRVREMEGAGYAFRVNGKRCKAKDVAAVTQG